MKSNIYLMELKDHSEIAVATKHDSDYLKGIVSSAKKKQDNICLHLLSDDELFNYVPTKIQRNLQNWHATFVSIPAKNIRAFNKI